MFNVSRCSTYPGSEYLEVGSNRYKVKDKHDHFNAKSSTSMSLPQLRVQLS